MPKVKRKVTSPAKSREIDRQREMVKQIDLAFDLWRINQKLMPTPFEVKRQSVMYKRALTKQEWSPQELIKILAVTMAERNLERRQRLASDQFIKSIYPTWGGIADHVMSPKSGGPKVKIDRKQIAIDFTVTYFYNNKKLPTGEQLSLSVSEELVARGLASEVEDSDGKRAYSVSSARDLLQEFKKLPKPNDDNN
jgi:hypothetical protein